MGSEGCGSGFVWAAGLWDSFFLFVGLGVSGDTLEVARDGNNDEEGEAWSVSVRRARGRVSLGDAEKEISRSCQDARFAADVA